MLHLHYSNRTEELVAALASAMRGCRAHSAANVLDPLALIVPNRHIEQYVMQALARLTGIAANIETCFLESFLTRLLEASASGTRLIDGAMMRALTLELLLDAQLIARPELAPVRQYLTAAGEGEESVDVRRFQLAAELGKLFTEYAVSRHEMLATWQQGPTLRHTPYAEAEAWQRALWLELFRPDGPVARRGRAAGVRYLPLVELVRAVDAAALGLPRALFLFGFSYVARGYHALLALLAKATDLFVFALNPCMDFWEDVRTDGELRAAGARSDAAHPSLFGSDDPYGIDAERDTPALRRWGRPGREYVRLLNDLSECNYEAHFVDPTSEGPSLLRQLQRDILVREPERLAPPASASFAADGSLAVLLCPSVRRELEIVANEIWSLVRQSTRASGTERPLRFDEVAVIVSCGAREAYLPHIEAVFREAYGLPYALVDLPLERQSRAVEAIEFLLALPKSAFTRHDVLRIVTHPCVVGRYDDVDPDDWIAWCDRLGIAHGGDREDHSGTYIERDRFNWDQGLRRLALGAMMAGERSGATAPFVIGDEAYLAEEVLVSRGSSAPRFGLLVRSLMADARFARQARLTVAEWASFFGTYLTTYLEPPTDDEEQHLLGALRAIDEMATMDVGDTEVSYELAAQIARSLLSTLEGRTGRGGVTVSSFVPMRAIPFRVVFLVGMEARKFPSSEPKTTLDLRLAWRQPGDVTARERDEYMFLDTLICARERLYLSYVDRDPVTGHAIGPSPVVEELLDMLRRGYLTGQEATRIVQRHPLRRFDPAYFADASAGAQPLTRPAIAEAAREAEARALRAELCAALGIPSAELDLGTLRSVLSPGAWTTLKRALGIVDIAGGMRNEARSLSLPIHALRKYLECPLQGFTRFVLGAEEDIERDLASRVDEPYGMEFPDATQFVRGALVRALCNREDVFRVYEALAHLEHLKGRMPEGLFAQAERETHRRLLTKWKSVVDAFTAGKPASVAVVHFGRADEHADVDRLHEALVFDVHVAGGANDPRSVKVELYGSTEPIIDGRGSLVLVRRGVASGTMEPLRRHREALRGFVDHVVLSAAGLSRGGPHAAVIGNAGADAACGAVTWFRPLSQSEALAYLHDLVEDMLGEVPSFFFPCEVPMTWRGEGELEPVVRAMRQERHSSRGPVPFPERYPAPPPATAYRIYARRYAPFFASIEEHP